MPNNQWGVKLGLQYGVRGLMLDTFPEFYEVAGGNGGVKRVPSRRRLNDGSLNAADLPGLQHVYELEGMGSGDARPTRRLANGVKGAPKGKALLCHGLCGLGSSPLVETLKIIVQWLEDNPREVQRASRVNLALCVFLCMSLFKVHACRIGAYL
jgi:hypothetical protein